MASVKTKSEEKINLKDDVGSARGDTKNSKMELNGSNGVRMDSDTVASEGALRTRSGYRVKKSDLIRIMVQSLHEIGCKKSADLLEEESGVRLEEPFVAKFRRCVLGGDWKSVNVLLPRMKLSPGNLLKGEVMTMEQEFLEYLELGQMKEALSTLRNRIALSHPDRERLNHLSSLMMYADPSDMRHAAKWEGVKGGSRSQLLARLQALMDPSFVVPESRLIHLVDQALAHQVAGCQFHNSKWTSCSLLHDHVCSLGEIPRTCTGVLEEHKDEVWYVAFSHNGTRMASASKDRSVIIWDMTKPSPAVVHRLLGHKKPPSFVCWSPDDTMLLSCDGSSELWIWEVKTGEEYFVMPKPEVNSIDSMMVCAWHPDGKHFITTGSLDKNIIIHDLEGTKVHRWSSQQMIRDMAVTQAGQLIVVGTNQYVRSYNLYTRKRESCSVREPSPVTSFCLSQDGRYALLGVSKPAAIKLWDLELEESVRHFDGIKQSRYVVQACFGGSGEAFVTSGSEDSQVYIWHRFSGDLLAVLPGHSGTVNSVSWSPTNPQLFVSASDDHTIRVWGVESKKGGGEATTS